MATENSRPVHLIGLGDMLREYALRATADRNAAYLLVHRVLAAAFHDGSVGRDDDLVASLRGSIDRLAGQSPLEAARRVAA